DGYVMARYLKETGLKTTVLVLAPEEKISGDALTNLKIVKGLDLEVHHIIDERLWDEHRQLLDRCDYILDGILGTGLNSPVKGFYKRVIDEVNSLQRPVMSIDIPSGLNADSGQVLGSAIKEVSMRIPGRSWVPRSRPP
ncbi:MAG: NAD(P)H-hydrate epimerase, partial [Deltaproteobacteria bacterium]|nr:NAD(P)H-hydrate epimerase [Deltaproteobacteria bacterium]